MSVRTNVLLLFFIVTSIGIQAAAQWTDDPRLGTWTINLAKSHFSPGAPPRSMTVLFEPYGDNGYRVTIDSVEANDEVTKHEYVASYDGKDYPVAGDPGRDTVSLKKIDRYILEYTNKRAGKVINSYREVIAPDLQSRSITQKGMSSRGVAVDNLIVYDKQPDPLLGAWRFNAAKSRYTPGPPLRSSIIRREPVPNGLHYTNDGVDGQGKAFHTEYTAYFDGKDHAISGDADRGSIALYRVDSRLVDTVNRKDGKISARGRWMVSPDGKVMTMIIQGPPDQSPVRYNVMVYDRE
jgi:hypothetical protein